jgi:hypothetical protein
MSNIMRQKQDIEMDELCKRHIEAMKQEKKRRERIRRAEKILSKFMSFKKA